MAGELKPDTIFVLIVPAKLTVTLTPESITATGNSGYSATVLTRKNSITVMP